MLRRATAFALFGIACFMTGCATQKSPHVDDPFEGLNRATFKFNKSVDAVVVKPVSYIYLKYLPEPFQVGIGNFFDNIREVTNVANDILQLKFAYASHDLSRFLINTTLGVGGIFDPAASLGLEHRKEDFGQTLYHWGYRHSYYVVLPFIGPSTFRDTIGLGVDYYGLSIWPWIDNDWEKYAVLGLDYLDLRARLLRKESVLDVLAVDEYTFMRDAYFQHRKYLFEGAANNTEEDIDGGEEPEGIELSAKSKKQEATKAPESKETNETEKEEAAKASESKTPESNELDKKQATSKEVTKSEINSEHNTDKKDKKKE
ncbi:MAG: VacJ family lipoprotein [Proteobacteria bacterium]|nr:VacJ family lipoprotein [Pseudomonadota bacterium]